MTLSMGSIFNNNTSVASSILAGNQNISNAQSNGISLVRQASQINQAQESLAVQMFRNEQARIDARELEQRRRFENDRNFSRQVFESDRNFGEQQRQFGTASAGQLLQAQISREGFQNSIDRIALQGANSIDQINARNQGALDRQNDAQAFEGQRSAEAELDRILAGEAQSAATTEGEALLKRLQQGDESVIPTLSSRGVSAATINANRPRPNQPTPTDESSISVSTFFTPQEIDEGLKFFDTKSQFIKETISRAGELSASERAELRKDASRIWDDNQSPTNDDDDGGPLRAFLESIRGQEDSSPGES